VARARAAAGTEQKLVAGVELLDDLVDDRLNGRAPTIDDRLAPDLEHVEVREHPDHFPIEARPRYDLLVDQRLPRQP
jgi:hypothetical protein